MLLDFLNKIIDTRRSQAKQYELGFMVFFSILAILSGADSYRSIESFFEVHFKKLKSIFKLKWKKRPAYTTIRNILRGINKEELEKVFREYSLSIMKLEKSFESRIIAIDGKVLKHSFDHFQDQKAINILTAFTTESKLIIAHTEIDQKTNEIPAATELIKELGLNNSLFSMDAMHCQKETLKEIKKMVMMQ